MAKSASFAKSCYAVIQGFGEGLDKGTAAGGTGLVELYAVYGVILDLDAFHILAADVQDAVYVRIKECSSVVVGDSLHLALIQHQGGL